MGECPNCIGMPLSGFEPSPGVQVELCAQCRGLYLDRDEIRELVGRGSLRRATEVVPVSLGDEVGMRCPKCVDFAMQPLSIKGAAGASSWQCNSCGGMWLPEGAFFALSRALRASLPIPPPRSLAPATSLRPSISDGDRLQHSRSRFDEGYGNLIAVPVLLTLSWWICSSSFGRLMSFLVGMPFHELGHALGSWLSSRIAIPLPFFTYWFNDQSYLMGFVVLSVLGWLMFHTYRENNRFMFVSATVMLLVWAIATFAISSRTTLMWQILSGALGELVFGAFLLIAFHFPLPDRMRWDFWRWFAVVPAALCFTQAFQLWRRAANDVSQLPWGSALGSAGDGDMNRLVGNFGWTAPELAGFYLGVAYVGAAALAAAYGYAIYRLVTRRRLRRATP